MHSARTQIEREFFEGAAVRLHWKTTQRVEDGVLYLGAGLGAGLPTNITNLCHEMSHFVEIDDDRILRHSWGLIWPEKFVYDRMVCEPTTHQMTDRELRVAAYQVNLYAYLGIKKTVTKTINSFHFLPDWWMVPGSEDSGKYAWCARQVYRLRRRPEFQIDAFKAEWARKNALLRRSAR